MNRNLVITSLLTVSLTFLTLGCEEQQSLDKTINKTESIPVNPPLQLNEIDNYFLGLNEWKDLSEPKPNTPSSKDGPEKPAVKEGKYECTSQDYSLTNTPEAVTVFSGSPGELWPGSVLQAAPYIDGKFVQLPLANYAPIDLTIDLAISEPSVTVQKPSNATMQAAIGTLLSRAKGTAPPARFTFSSKEAYSTQQLLLDFNLSAKYMNQSAKGSLNIESTSETRTVAAYFVQNMFTVSVPAHRTPSSYFSDITMSKILDQQDQKRLGKSNPPLYVSSVTYGRVLLFTMRSTSSKEDIKAALDYAYKGGAELDVNTKAKYKKILNTAEISVVPYGGPWADPVAVIKNANINAYFSDTSPPLTTAVPISYKLNTLARGAQATVAETSKYTQRDCHIAKAPAILKNAKFSLQYVGGGDNRYLSVAKWSTVVLEGKRPYPTLQLKPVQLKFRGNNKAFTSGSNIRFSTLEKKAQGKALGKDTELGAWKGKKYASYLSPQSGPKQNWIFSKKCGKAKCDKYIRYGDNVSIRSEYKPKQYLCNDSNKKSEYLITKAAACTWKILKP